MISHLLAQADAILINGMLPTPELVKSLSDLAEELRERAAKTLDDSRKIYHAAFLLRERLNKGETTS